jgi:hypothetical protein
VDAPPRNACRARRGDRTATLPLRCAAFSAAPPSCHFTAAPRWCPFPGLTCSLALRGHDPLRKLASHACSRGQGLRDGCSVPSITLRDTAPACSPTGTPLRAALLTGRDILVHRMACAIFSTRDLRPGPRAFASFRPKRPSLARAPRPSAAPFAARCAPSDRSLHSAAPCLPAHSRVPVTRVRCPVHVCVDRALPQHGERAHQALAVAKGRPRVMARQCERDRARLRTHTARRARRERRTGRDRGHYRVVAGAHVVHSS